MGASESKPLEGTQPHSNHDVFPSSSSNITQHVRGGNNVVAGGDVIIGGLYLPSKPVTEFMLVDEPNIYFTGRKDIVDAIHMRFKLCNNQSIYADRMVLLYGMGGIGKSETARFYAFKYHNDSIIKNVAWIDAETETSLKASFILLAQTLRLQNVQENDNVKQIVSMIYQYFSDNIGTGLFIFDNAPQMNRTEKEFGIFDFLPLQLLKRRPFVLITSRDKEWKGILPKNTIQVEELTDADSAEFLIKALELTDEQQTSKIEMAAVNRLAKTLYGYPLGLALSSSNIRNAKWTAIAPKIEMYIQRMEVSNGPWTHDTFSAGSANKYKLIMSNVWLASLDNIASLPNNKGIEALKLLKLMAYLPTYKITLQNVSQIFKSVFKASCNEDSFALLEKYAFINVMLQDWQKKNQIRIHRLVQHCIRAQLEGENDVTLFEICNYKVITKVTRKGGVLDFMPVMHKHLKQRNWPGDSIKYSVMFCSLCISLYSNLKEGLTYIEDAQSFLDSSNQTCCEDPSLEILLCLCLCYYRTSKHILKEITKNLSITTKTKEVILQYKKDYLRHLLGGSLYDVDKDEMNPNCITELSNRVCYQILENEDPLLEKEFGSDFSVLENLVICLNSSDQTGMTTKDAIKIYKILWKHVSRNVPLSVVQATKCAVKIHRLLQPRLLEATKTELQNYWLDGSPFEFRIFYWNLTEDDWSRAFVDAFFIKNGPQILGQQLAFLSTIIGEFSFLSVYYSFDCIIKLAFAWNCRSKFIRDADFMESLLLFSKRLFSSKMKQLDQYTEMCIIIWFCLFRHNETADDCRGRSWSINDVTDEITLFHAAGGFFEDEDFWFRKCIDVFVTFVEATKDKPESAAGKLAKEIIKTFAK